MTGPLRDTDDGGDDELHEINVTPFIDVILVLLIIFMVAAPLSTVDIPVQLPASTAKAEQRPDKPLFLTIAADMRLTLGEEGVQPSRLVAALDAATSGNRESRLFLRADKSVPYGELIKVLDVLRNAGYLKVGLVTLEAGSATSPRE